MSLQGIVRNGVIVIDGEKKLPEGAKVEVLVEGELLGRNMEKFVGILKGPPDLARNHDHYFHGTPKQ